MKGKVVNSENKSFETMICGITFTGNKKKVTYVIKLHKKICIKCQNFDVKVKSGDIIFLKPDISDEKDIGRLMEKGLDFKTAYDKVYNKLMQEENYIIN